MNADRMMRIKTPLRDNAFFIAAANILGLLFFLIPLLWERGKRLCRRRRPEQIQRILLIELWGIGDLVLASGALKALRQHFPAAEIDLLAKPIAAEIFLGGTGAKCPDARLRRVSAETSSSEVAQANEKETPQMGVLQQSLGSGWVDEVIGFVAPWTAFQGKYRLGTWDWQELRRVICSLRQKKYDLVLDARGDIRNNLLSFLTGGARRIGYDWTGGGYFLTEQGLARQPGTVQMGVLQQSRQDHRVKAWAGLLAPLTKTAVETLPCLYVSADEKVWARTFLAERGMQPGDCVVGIHPGAAQKIRCWPLARFAQVAEYVRQQYRAKLLVFVEPGGYGREIPIAGETVMAQLPLRQLLAVLAEIRLLICNDSGVMHLAAALGTPVLAVFGPGDFSLVGPVAANCRCVSVDVACRPCYDNCVQESARCLDDVSVEMVKKVVGEIFATRIINV